MLGSQEIAETGAFKSWEALVRGQLLGSGCHPGDAGWPPEGWVTSTANPVLWRVSEGGGWLVASSDFRGLSRHHPVIWAAQLVLVTLQGQ